MESMTVQTQPKRTFFSRVFISPNGPRLRAGWRLILQTLMMAVIFIGIAILPYRLVSPPTGSNIETLIGRATELMVTTLTVFIARRFLDKRSFKSLGLTINRRALMDVFTGVCITFLIMGMIYLTETVLGWLTFETIAWQVEPISTVIGGILITLAIYIFVGWNEELLSRGYQLQTLASGLNLFWAVLISSAVFGILHLFTPNATWVSAAMIFLAGLFLAYGYVRTEQLWLPIGLHIGWNFFEGVVFGFRVSGLDVYHVIHHQVTGPELWTGGIYGPEAGLIILPALVIGMALIYVYTRSTRQPNPKINFRR